MLVALPLDMLFYVMCRDKEQPVTGDPERVTWHRQPREARNVVAPSKAHRQAYVTFSSYPKGSVVTGDGLLYNFPNDFRDHDSGTVSGH